jgi:DNA-directed RNA polymerase subunit M/transcription elongation factor TFIIS
MDQYFEKSFKFLQYTNLYHNLPEKEKIQQEEIVSTHVTCLKCKSNKILLNVKQVRSGDEGQTTFCTCTECGSKWTVH